MESHELLQYIDLFREKAEHNKLVVFVGAGVSCNVEGMPDWNLLIQNMAKAIGYSKCTFCRHKEKSCEEACLLKNDYSADEFLKIPQYVFNADKELYNRVLSESISTSKVLEAPLSSAIFDINPAHIITTNYDQLLESSKNLFCEQYQVIVSDKDLLSTNKGRYIIKMHGDLQSPQSIVLKEQDYLEYSQKHVLLELFIKSLLTDHIVLFLGYSLNDYNIKLIISWINYMRSQNGAIDEGRRVGYIVLDQAQINDMQKTYLNSNNIEAININGLKPIQDIPATLPSEKGQRLFSFLRIIADHALEEDMVSIKRSVQFMMTHTFINYERILKLLYVKNYNVTDGQLRLFDEGDYTRLTTFMKANTKESNNLKHLFINSGISLIFCSNANHPEKFTVGNFSENILFQDPIYSLYILNKYNDIQSLLENNSKESPTLKELFYRSIVEGYGEVEKDYSDVDMSQLNTDQKVAYLHNCAAAKAVQSFSFDSTKVRHFIQNIASTKERELFEDYLDIYNGNTEKRLKMQTSLEKLKKDVGDANTVHFGSTSCGRIYEIKQLVMTEYFFYYNNNILYQGFKDLKDFFRPYIEAIMCSNSDAAAVSSHFCDMEIVNQKYSISCIDFDIITKFISTKELNTLITTYDVKRLSTNTKEIKFLVDCFKNLCHSISATQVYGFNQSSLISLTNIASLLNLVILDDNDKMILGTSIEELLSNGDILEIFFSIGWPDFRLASEIFSKLCNQLALTHNRKIIWNIVTNKSFFDYAVNVNFGNLRKLVTVFIPKNNKISSIELQNILNSTDNFQKKIILLRLFYKHIDDEIVQKNYKDFLSEHFVQLSTDAIYDFVFSGWLTPTCGSVEEFLKGILKISRERTHGVHSFPDPVQTRLECVYLMYINDLIKDIRILDELAEGRPHLQFLLDQETFDYTQVDFSNYMWDNFARHEKYMKCFITHKEPIISKIKRRIEENCVSETETKILYGFLLDKEKIWEI